MSTLTLEEKKDRRISAVITAIFHGLLILLFILWRITSTDVPGDDSSAGGILINFGTSETGLGDQVPQSTVVAEPSPPQPQNQPSQNSNAVMTQDVEDAPVIDQKKDKPKKVTEPQPNPSKSTTTEPVKPTPQKPKALFPGNTNNSTSQGNTKPGDDQGKNNGDPNSFGNSDSGGGNDPFGKGGTGIGLNMAGRRILQYPSITDNSQKTGRVIVNIKVDRFGKVIYAKATRQGSTTDDGYLFSLAEKAAYQTRINTSDMVEQHGTMAFNFRVK